MATRLGLSGTPRRAPLWKNLGLAGGARPAGRYSRLGPTGTSAKLQTFEAKEPADGSGNARPAGRYSRLGPTGTSINPRPPFAPKAASVGVVGRTTLTLTPHATVIVGRRYTQVADLVLGIRPMGAVITVAHTSNRQGRTTVTLTPAATLRYTRAGQHHSIQGNNVITLATFGAITIRHRHATVGTNAISIVSKSVGAYTPAPVRSHRIQGRVTTRITPQATLARAIGGLDHAITGSTTLTLTPTARIRVTRATTYSTHGSVTLRITPQGAITKGTGPPVAYYIQGRTTVTLRPSAILGYNLGDFEQHNIQGSVLLELVPRGRITYRAAPSVTPDFGRGERSFIRVGTRTK